MEYIALVIAVVALLLNFNVRDRIRRLEEGKGGEASPVGTNAPAVALGVTAAAVDPALLNYIKDQIARGARRPELEADLVRAGWTSAAVSAAFTTLTSSARTYGTTFVPPPPGGIERFFAWCREEWLLKLGALLLLMALGWFTTYAFMNNWIGEGGRIALGLALGSLFLVLGAWRIRAHVEQGGVFLVVGSTTILLTLFAARVAYDMFTPSSVLAMMFLSTAFVAVMSVLYKRSALATAAFILAAVAPLLTNSPEPSYTALFSYLLVITLGAVVISAVLMHRSLIVTALLVFGLYSLPHFDSSHVETATVLLFAFAFAALFFIAHSGGIVRSPHARPTADLLAAVGNGLLLTTWIMTTAPSEWQSLLLVAWLMLFVVGAFVVFRLTGRQDAFLVYGVVGVGMLAAATAAELSGPALTIAYTLEVALIVVVLFAMTRSAAYAARGALLFVVPIVLALPSASASHYSSGLPADHVMVLLTLALSLLGTGAYCFLSLPKVESDTEKNTLQQLGSILTIIGSLVVYVLLWRILHVVLPSNLAVLVSLTLYTIVGITAYVFGSRQGSKAVRIYGGLLIGFVVARLLFIDVWSLDTPGRIVTFAFIGVLLMSTAFISRRRS